MSVIMENKKKNLNSDLTEKLISFSDEYSRLLVPAILILALVLRIIALFNLRDSVYYDYLLFDERVYHEWAKMIASGTSKSYTVYDFAPLPAYMMGFVYWVLSPKALYIRILNIIFDVLSCYLIFLIGKEMRNNFIGIVSSFIAAIYKPFIFFSILLHKTSFAVFLFSASIYLFFAILNKYSKFKLVLLGIAIGLLLNVRTNCVVIVPLFMLFILIDIYKDKSPLKKFVTAMMLFIAGLSIALLPFAIRNYRISGEITPIPKGGFNLYLGNNLINEDPYYRPLPFASPEPSLQARHFVIEASRRVGRKLTLEEASSFWTDETIKVVLEHPKDFLLKLFRKALIFFNSVEIAANHHIDFISNFVRFFKLPLISIWLLLPFGIAGMIMNIRESRKMFALSLIFLMYASTLVLFFTNIRYRLPMLIILIPAAAIGIERLYSYFRSQQFRKVSVYIVIVTAFFVTEFLPVKGTDDMTSYYNTHALALCSKGRINEAARYLEISSNMDMPYSDYAKHTLALLLKRMGEADKAILYLKEIPQDSLAAYSSYDLLGDIMGEQKKYEDAVAYYKKSLNINYGQRGVWIKMIKALEQIDKEEALREFKQYQYICSFYE